MDEFRRHEASEHYERAIALERAGRIDEAIAEYRRALAVDPGFAEAYEALGRHYYRRGFLTKALDAFSTAVRLEATYSRLFTLGHLLTELERYDEALEVFQGCLKISPEDPLVFFDIAYIYYHTGRAAEALGLLHKTLEGYPEDWEVDSLIAACQLVLGRWLEAEETCRRALTKADSPEKAADSEAGLQMALRFQEFPGGFPLGPKDRLYAEEGVVLLGTLGDDGLQVPLREGSLSEQAVAVTMRRLQALLQELGIFPDAIVAVDRAAHPLAFALAEVLAAPRRRLSELDPESRPLLVLAAGRQAELLQVAQEQAPSRAISFVLALAWAEGQRPLPDLIGVLLQEPTLPWTEGRLSPEEMEAAGRSLLEQYAALSPEKTLPAQVAYYAEKHRRLRLLAGREELA